MIGRNEIQADQTQERRQRKRQSHQKTHTWGKQCLGNQSRQHGSREMRPVKKTWGNKAIFFKYYKVMVIKDEQDRDPICITEVHIQVGRGQSIGSEETFNFPGPQMVSMRQVIIYTLESF